MVYGMFLCIHIGALCLNNNMDIWRQEKKMINLPKIGVKYNARENYNMMMVMVKQDRLIEHMWREVLILNNNHGRPGNEGATRMLMDLSSYESESLFLKKIQSWRGHSSKTGFARGKDGQVGSPATRTEFRLYC
jgi:hypothetical protein